MNTKIRPELSERNKYWIDKHRYYELKHFCLQYPVWKKAYFALEGLNNRSVDLAGFSKTNDIGDPTAKCAEARLFYAERMDLIERTAAKADSEMASYILKGVTTGVSYDHLKARLEIPCCRDTYYDLYRRFFWILNKERQ